MPSHENAQAIGRALDSDGIAITPVMWRANRLVDILAKMAAGHERIPTFITSQVGAAAKLVQHSAGLLGEVTYVANHCARTEVVEGGATVTRIMRDSTAERPRWKALAPRGEALSEVSSPVARSSWPNGSVHRTKRSAPSDSEGMRPSSCSADALRRKVCKEREAPEDSKRVASWLASRSFSTSSQPAAADRMAALRDRIRAKRAHAGESNAEHCSDSKRPRGA